MTRSHKFSRASRTPFASSFDWFTESSVSFMILARVITVLCFVYKSCNRGRDSAACIFSRVNEIASFESCFFYDFFLLFCYIAALGTPQCSYTPRFRSGNHHVMLKASSHELWLPIINLTVNNYPGHSPRA